MNVQVLMNCYFGIYEAPTPSAKGLLTGIVVILNVRGGVDHSSTFRGCDGGNFG